VPEPPVPIDERRARVRRWTRFASLEHVTAGRSQGGGQCMICDRLMDPGEVASIITFKSGVSLRLDQACMDLWHEEAEPPPSP
jgi:hypothetical protein